MIDLDNAFKRRPRRIPASVKAQDNLQLSSDSDGNIFEGLLNNPPTDTVTGAVFRFIDPTGVEQKYGDPWMDNSTMSKCEIHFSVIGR
jgi:hypothetical protein